MANVTLPTTVCVAGGALCVLAGYLVGYVVAPDANARTTAQVVSFDTRTSRLCLEGDSVQGKPGAADGELCGTWSRGQRSSEPHQGDHFRFVSVRTQGSGRSTSQTLIYGSVVG